MPRDRDGSFEPKIVKKRQKRLTGVDEMVMSLAAKGLTTGEVQAHLAEVHGAEVHGAEVSRQTISTITHKVLEGMAEWRSRRAGRLCRDVCRGHHGVTASWRLCGQEVSHPLQPRRRTRVRS